MLKEPEAMAQIHRIRAQMYEQEKHLSSQERVAKTHQEAERILKAWRLTLKRVPPPSTVAR